MQDVFTMARTTASTPLDVDRMTKASLVARSKRSNSELSVDGLALLASTVIEEWDHNSQQNHRRRLEISEMSIVSRKDQWLEKHNKLKEFYQKHGHARVTYSNCEDKSLVRWVNRQRRCCKIESRIKLLNAVGFVWSVSESSEERWLEKYNQLKEFYQKHGHAQANFSNCGDKSLVIWVNRQRHHCKMESRLKLLNAIGFAWSASEAFVDRWLEKYNQLKEFHQKHGHTKATYSNCEDNSLVRWARKQRRGCKMEKQNKVAERCRVCLVCVGETGDQWLEKVNELKEFCKLMPSDADDSLGALAALSLQHAKQKKDDRVNRIHLAPMNL